MFRLSEVTALDSSKFWSTTGVSSDGQRIFVIQSERESSTKRSFGYYISTYSQEGRLVGSCFALLKEKHKLINLIGSYEISHENSVYDKLVFVTSLVNDNDSKKSIITIDTKHCKERENLREHDLIIADKTLDNTDVFDIIIKNDGDHNTTCANDGECQIISLDVETSKIRDVKPFVVNLTWSGLSFKKWDNKNLLVNGINDDHEFKWIFVDRSTGKFLEMLSLLGFTDNQKILHSGLTSCWINNQGVDKKVYCRRLGTDDRDKTVLFQESVHLLFVHATTSDEILIVTAKLKKNSKWGYKATKIRYDGTYTKPVELPVLCVDIPSFLNDKYNAYENEISFQYVCEHTSGFYFNEISIAMDDD